MNFNPKRLSGTVTLMVALGVSSVTLAADFAVKSPTLKDNGTLPKAHVFNNFGCTGDNRSPELNWENAPAGTQSFAITAFDPDAPTDSGWWHWVVVNIPGSFKGIREGDGNDAYALPENVKQIRSDFGSQSFGGACPPEGAGLHRYIFTVYALKVKSLDLPENVSAALTSFMIKSNAIAKASITTVYGR